MLKVYCDGACSGNPGPGAWAYLAIDETDSAINIIASATGSYTDTTNNRMELLAAINAAAAFDNCIFVVDSMYVKDGITKWIHTWKKNGWKSKTGAVKNIDLWQALDKLVQTKKAIEWVWEKGHNKTTHDLVDKLARTSVLKSMDGTWEDDELWEK